MTHNPRLTPLGRLTLVLVVALLLWLGYRNYAAGRFAGLGLPGPTRAPGATGGDGSGAGGGAGDATPDGERVRVGVAYGTEKERWLEWAVERFAASPEGRGVAIELLPMGSLEGAQAIVRGDERIDVWTPAASLYEPVFRADWAVRHAGEPFHRREILALTPMVFVGWEERFAAMVAKYGPVSFETVRRAMLEPSGWQGIASRPEWGFFKFGHTHPNQSNSGLVTLLAMAAEHAGRRSSGAGLAGRRLGLADVVDAGFQGWMVELERGASGLTNSTGNLMREMVLKGPSTFDLVFVYENVAIDYLAAAEGRWGELRVAYPAVNVWNDNPCYVLAAPWTDAPTRAAADRFVDYLLSPPVQEQAVVHGFRPGNPEVPIRTAQSAWTRFAGQGLAVEMPAVVEPPPAEVLTNLLTGWQRHFGDR